MLRRPVGVTTVYVFPIEPGEDARDLCFVLESEQLLGRNRRRTGRKRRRRDSRERRVGGDRRIVFLSPLRLCRRPVAQNAVRVNGQAHLSAGTPVIVVRAKPASVKVRRDSVGETIAGVLLTSGAIIWVAVSAGADSRRDTACPIPIAPLDLRCHHQIQRNMRSVVSQRIVAGECQLARPAQRTASVRIRDMAASGSAAFPAAAHGFCCRHSGSR